MLGIVTCLFNPAGYARTAAKYQQFRAQLRHDCVVTAELSWDNTFLAEDGLHFHGSASHILWQKERLLNLAIQELPAECDKVAWVDADLLFQNPDWIRDAEAMLEDYPVVQLFESVVNLGPDGRPMSRTQSWGSAAETTTPQLADHQVGHGWAIRRELIPDGLYDGMITGGGDWLMASAWLGHLDRRLLEHLPVPVHDDYHRWAEPQTAAVQGRVGCVPGEILHLYHGEKTRRLYFERYTLLRQHSFDPAHDLQRDDQDLWVWSGNKPELANAVKSYFQFRREDDSEVAVQSSTMTPQERRLLEQYQADSQIYLEFGMGESTLLACANSRPISIDTVESSREFLQSQLQQHSLLKESRQSGRLTVHVPEIGATGSWGYPRDQQDQTRWKNYAELIHSLDQRWDTIFVDGRFRVATVMNLLLRVDPSTRILIHDFWNRNHYHVLLNYLDTVRSVDTMGVFTKRQTCTDDRLLQIRHNYYTDPR